MYTEYEGKMERLARILKVVKKIALVAAVVVPVFLLFCFGVGFRYRGLRCDSVVYGTAPNPSSGFSAIGETTYEYRNADSDDSEWTTEVPVLPGKYEVRAHSVSFLGVKSDSDSETFQILPKELKINLSDIEISGDPREYDLGEIDYSVAGLQYDDRLELVVIEKEFDASDDYMTYYLDGFVIVHADGSDARDCYRIPVVKKKIIDTRVKITVRAESRTMTYDGDPFAFLHCDEWSIVQGSLKKGHTAEFHCDYASYDGLGSLQAVNRIISGKITDENGNDVTDQYRITYMEGTLRMERRNIILTSGSASKEYDGKPLTNPEYTVTGDGLADGDKLDAKCTGYIVNIGTTPNYISVTGIQNDRYGDVSEYYMITTKTGKLTVLGGQSGDGAGDIDGDGSGKDGSPGGLGKGEIVSANEDGFNLDMFGEDGTPGFDGMGTKPVKVFSFYAQSNRPYYFKEFSYGNYNGHGFTKTQGEEEYLPWCNYLTGNALINNGGTRDSVSIRDLALKHPVYPYFMTGDLLKGSVAGSYSCETYFSQGSWWYYLSNDEREAGYRDFVYSAYMDVPEDVASILRELGDAAGLNRDSSNLIEEIAFYIQNSAKYNLKFKQFPQDQDMVVYFLTSGKEGICQHYAAAATLMYRVYGIPARFVVGFRQDGKPGKWTTVTTNVGHAWVEIYIDGTGWVPVEVTGGGGGIGGLLPGGDEYDDWDSGYMNILVQYDNYTRVYDGKRSGRVELNWHLVSGRLRDGDQIIAPAIVVEDEEIYRNVGEHSFDVSNEVRIVDATGKNVTNMYSLAVMESTYRIIQRDLSLLVYAEYSDINYTRELHWLNWDILDGSLADGHRLEVFVDNSEDGYSGNYGVGIAIGTLGGRQVMAVIRDENGVNVTDNYYISCEFRGGELY